jgi:hypothetical protein
MKNISGYFALIAFLISMAGCASIRGAPNAPRTTSVAQSDPAYLVSPDDLKKYRDETDPEKKRIIRNDILDERVLEVDHQFGEFEIELWRQGIGSGIATDWTQLAIAGLTATVGAGTTKVAFGASQAAVVGAKASFDKNAYMEKTLPVLMAQMVAERETIRAEIEQNKQKTVMQYSLYAALSDLRRYIRAGSIPGVIQAIAQEAGAKAKKADDEIKNIRMGKYVKDDAGERLLKFWKPDGKNINKSNQEKLVKWLKENGQPTGPGDITMFLRDEAKSDLRVRAVRELLQN